MRIVVAILLVLAVHNSPARAEESPAASTADRAAPHRDHEAAFLAVPLPASEVAQRPIVLVPSVRSGHSIMWKTGAAVTFVSLAVSAIGAGLTLGGLQGINLDGGQSHNNGGMFLAGIVISAIGDGGAFLGGPITWIAGIGGPRD